jgi:hypothetical protein
MGARPSVFIYRNPYSTVDWASYVPAKAQHHDHIGTNTGQIKAYDNAGYRVVSLMNYSGVASLSYSLKERPWPPSAALTTDFISSLKNISLFVSNAEEIGVEHITSSFMTSYIALWEPSYYPTRLAWHYSSIQEAIDLVRNNGGVPIIAHPWEWNRYSDLQRYAGIEIYTAYAMWKYRTGEFKTDLNQDLVKNWDIALRSNPRLLGIAVNDHFGPGQPDIDTDVRDSGKILVWLKPGFSPSEYEAAFRAGQFVAVKDLGRTKDLHPSIASITVTDSLLEVRTTGAVSSIRWIANGIEIGHDPALIMTTVPASAAYVRAEIANAEGSVIYTQAFTVSRMGDTNNDGAVNLQDAAVCAAVQARQDTDPYHVNACAVRKRVLGT